MDKLTPKQERFANEYIKTLNVTQSAIKAGYSPNSAHVTGSRLLRKEKVDKYIKSKKDEIMDDTILSAKELLYLLTQAAVGDETETKEAVVKKGTFERNPDSGRMNLVYNEHVETVEIPIKPSDRLKARDLLGRYHSLFTEKVDLNVATPVFIDSIDEDDEKNERDIENLSKQYPNAEFHIDDIR
ncbi:terminase small subunit [Staphylococcus epidermidis]|uniref:terminase small subunit n=1 Tax=Staphylococcus epidermidis TaxID=1282 RepID=UPI00026C1F95|nr:terminase small subunit [Staphylococcus epidermidis]EJD95503.1 phage terminase family protein [Staphylococcus epidermidis NIHLM049]EZI14022.1 terminase small subunit [Staphylococcus epidermidis VCU050]MCC3666886.1 terminase small subunit [Staphylococcus epidermidis]MCG1064196.1 terminase small subunit [Staphylococcus epidermidis]MCG1246774.1 terminase small subunit [Staphylococcus epidermidis]